MDEKRERQQQLQLIEQERQKLEEERLNLAQIRYNIDQRNNDLKVIEAKLNEIEPLIPSVKELQSVGMTFDLIVPYVMAINEKSALENVDLKTAAWNMVRDFREYRDLGCLRRAKEKAEEKLSALDAFSRQKQQAITTLMNLHMAGFGEKDIAELTGLVNIWNARSGIPSLSHNNGNNGGRKLDTELIGVGQ